jgi:hypothetical protein
MSAEVSPASKSTPASVVTQAVISTKELIGIKASEGTVPAPATPLGTPSQPNPASAAALNQHKPTTVAAGTANRNGSLPPRTMAGSSPSNASGVAAGQQTLTSTAKVTVARKTPTPLTHHDRVEEPTSVVVTPDDIQKETALAGEISELWSSHQGQQSSLRRSRGELQQLRTKLAERLYEYKNLLARTGRGGRWTEYLRQTNISRTTADRYIEKWKASSSPRPAKRPSGAIDEPTNEEIAEMVKNLRPKLQRLLPTPNSVALFLTALAAALHPPEVAS